jgi:hypothetical protein
MFRDNQWTFLFDSVLIMRLSYPHLPKRFGRLQVLNARLVVQHCIYHSLRIFRR